MPNSCRDNIKLHCLESTSVSIIKVYDQRTELKFKNPLQKVVEKIVVDGCQIDDDASRCDFLLIYPRDGEFDEHFVELKGNYGFNKAKNQLKSCISRLGCDGFKMRFAYYITFNRMPASGNDIQKAKREFMKNHKAYFIAKQSNKFTQDLESPKTS